MKIVLYKTIHYLFVIPGQMRLCLIFAGIVDIFIF